MTKAPASGVSEHARATYFLDQNEGWEDRFARWHVLDEMSSDYLRAVIRFLEQRAKRLAAHALYRRVRQTSGSPQPSPLAAGSALDWLRETVLVRALYAKLATRGEPLTPETPLALGVYETGTGQRLGDVHPATACREHGLPCVIHAPSEHPLRESPTHWNADEDLFERICAHGFRHPDPDWLTYLRRRYGAEIAAPRELHGCDGCCLFEPRGCPTCGGVLRPGRRGSRGFSGPLRSWTCDRCHRRYPV